MIDAYPLAFTVISVTQRDIQYVYHEALLKQNQYWLHSQHLKKSLQIAFVMIKSDNKRLQVS